MADLRRDERTGCKLRATINCLGKETTGTLLNISLSGGQLYLRADIAARRGSMVTVTTEELGAISGDVVWTDGPKLGFELAYSSNTAAKITSFHRNYD